MRGCVPKKLLVYGGEFANEFKECEGYGYVISQFMMHCNLRLTHICHIS